MTPAAEWLEAHGDGAFASGTTDGIRTRRYHALLMTARTPPSGRMILVNGFEAWVETPGGRFALTSQHYAPDVIHPDGATRIADFTADPWPTWTFRLPDGTRIVQDVVVPPESGTAIVTWKLPGRAGGVTLHVRPLLSGRDLHALHHENPAFRFDADAGDGRVTWRPYEGLPSVTAAGNGRYAHAPEWYRGFVYAEERARGLDFIEDLASPGTFSWDLSEAPAMWVLATDEAEASGVDADAVAWAERARARERRRRKAFPSRLHRAGDAYIVRRGEGRTVVAGYPWFADWGRDTFISIRGLCLATGRLREARDMLLEWAGAVSEGMLPNRFVEEGDAPEYNSVDASLWYVVAVGEYLAAAGRVPAATRRTLEGACEAILAGYAAGTRHGIRADTDGLLAAGAPGVQLTWMDAKVGDWVVTPRIGKPVEIQALWVAALESRAVKGRPWGPLAAKARRAFAERFWNEDAGCLFDVVDADHVAGAVDRSIRPNQIFAVGGLPRPLLTGERAKRVVDVVERRLWTPLGPRSLDPADPAYRPRYEGGVASRDGAYHQGTVWPWVAGPFVEAWVRTHGDDARARAEARRRFLEPLLRHLDEGGLGHISEIADAEAPHVPRGCPFQAWSVAEALRLAEVVCAR